MDTVGGSPLYAIESVLLPKGANRVIQGQGVAGPAAIPIGRHHSHVRQLRQGIGQGDDTLGVVSIVVTNQDFHLNLSSSAFYPRIRWRKPRYSRILEAKQ